MRPSLNKCWFAVSDRPVLNAATQKKFSVFSKQKKIFFRLIFSESGNLSVLRSNISITARVKMASFDFSSEVVFSHISVLMLLRIRRNRTLFLLEMSL
jgi:hypothetical protein